MCVCVCVCLCACLCVCVYVCVYEFRSVKSVNSAFTRDSGSLLFSPALLPVTLHAWSKVHFPSSCSQQSTLQYMSSRHCSSPDLAHSEQQLCSSLCSARPFSQNTFANVFCFVSTERLLVAEMIPSAVWSDPDMLTEARSSQDYVKYATDSFNTLCRHWSVEMKIWWLGVVISQINKQTIEMINNNGCNNKKSLLSLLLSGFGELQSKSCNIPQYISWGHWGTVFRPLMQYCVTTLQMWTDFLFTKLTSCRANGNVATVTHMTNVSAD